MLKKRNTVLILKNELAVMLKKLRNCSNNKKRDFVVMLKK